MKPATKELWWPRLLLAAIIIGGLFIRLWVVSSRLMVDGDQIAYLDLARNLVGGSGYISSSGETDTNFFPLLPLLVAGAQLLLDDITRAGYVIVIVFGSLLPLLAYQIGRELRDRDLGLRAAVLTGFLPIMVEFSTLVYTEILFAFFLMAAAIAFIRLWRGGGVAAALLAGVSLGLAYLGNPAALFFVIGFFILILFFRSGWTWQRRAALSVGMLAVFCLLAVPYISFLHQETGNWTYSSKDVYTSYLATAAKKEAGAQDLDVKKEYQSLSPDGHTFKVDDATSGSTDPLRLALRDPAQFLGGLSFNLQSFHKTKLVTILPVSLLLLLGLGLFARPWDRHEARRALFLLVMMAPVLLALSAESNKRYVVPYLPFLLVFIAMGWRILEDWLRGTLEKCHFIRPGAWRYVVPIVTAVAVIAPLIWFTRADRRDAVYPLAYRQAGEWLGENAGMGKRIMSPSYAPALYADGTTVIMPYADLEATNGYARYHDVDYFVISRREIGEVDASLAALLPDGDGQSEWLLVHSIPTTTNSVFIFQRNSG